MFVCINLCICVFMYVSQSTHTYICEYVLKYFKYMDSSIAKKKKYNFKVFFIIIYKN